jgi:Tfp pilus assembly protein PilN
MPMLLPPPISKDLRKLLAFGSGVGVEIGPESLEVVVARVRAARVHVLGRLAIPNFAGRPAAEWGGEYGHFLRSLGVGHLSATVLLPRREIIVRQIALPGVGARDLESALRLQLDSLHPYGEDEISWGWSPLAPGTVLVGIARRAVVERYIQLFMEAGIAVASFTFSAAAIHAAIRLDGAARGDGFVALGRSGTGAMEVYGESPARPLFSAEFNLPPERAAALALSELRLPPDTAAVALDQVLPAPLANPGENDLSRNALPYATALAGACPRLAPAANVLPLELRKSSSRLAWIPTLSLAALLGLAMIGTNVYSRIAERRYVGSVDAEIARLRPQAERAAALDSAIEKARARAQLLERFRAQTRHDLDALNELTHLIEPPAWTSAINLTREQIRISGEAPQAAPLLKVLDSSKLFRNSVLDSAPRSGAGEQFQIHMSREYSK